MKKVLAVSLVTAMALSISPSVFANPDGEASSPPSYEVVGGLSEGFKNEGQRRQTKTTSCQTDCTSGGITQRPIIDYQFSKTIWFNDEQNYFASAPAGGSFMFNFDTLYSLSKTTVPKADKNFGYGGNAIPAPGSGSFVIKDTLTVTGTKIVDTQPVFQKFFDPITGEVTEREVDGYEWEQQNYEYRVSVTTMNAPALQNRRCVTHGEYQLNGPYEKNQTPMKPATEGGTMTRTPKNNGVVSHLGDKVSLKSSLGATMSDSKSGTPAVGAIWANCLPNQDTKFEQQKSESISDLGRYEAPTTLWGSPVNWLAISGSQSDIARVYPRLTSNGQATDSYRYLNGIGYFILGVNATSKMAPFSSYYKIVCDNGTQATKRSEFVTVNAKSYDGWDAQPWNDAGADYYSWDCSGGKALPPTEVNTESVLQCATYGGAGGVVENKPAAPLLTSSILIDNEINVLEKKNGVYRVPSTADPIHFQWQKIRFNTQDGTNILSSPKVKNDVWEFTYKLDPASSPMLKNTDVNDLTQPYHGWVDSTPETVGSTELASGSGIKKWEPGKYYGYEVLSATYSYKDYTYTTKVDLSPYTYRSETRVTGSYSYPCGTYTYQSGTETYQCGGGYSVVSSGGATWYWWVGRNGGWACPAGWWLSGTTCFTNTYIPPQYCSRPTFATGTNYCSAPTYGTFSVKNAPPAGYFDNGSQYQKNTTVKNPAPTDYTDNGISYQKVNPPPAGYTDMGTAYISNGTVNRTGQFGGLEFNEFNEWPSRDDDPLLKSCTVNPSDYGINGVSASTIRCGDNVTEKSRAAYFRYFQSSTAGSGGWRVTPWVKVTADVRTSHSQVSGVRLMTDGTLSTSSDTVTNWIREPFSCPAQPISVNIERVVG